MKQKVFLSAKKVFFQSGALKNLHDLENRIAQEIRTEEVIDAQIVSQKIAAVDRQTIKVRKMAELMLDNGGKALVLSVSRAGLVGMFYYCVQNDYLQEMIDPDVKTPYQIVCSKG